jgi:Rieske 2Fe-2S family protein
VIRGKNLVCPYHKWAYDIDDGRLCYAREMSGDFDPGSHGLMPVNVECVSSYIWVCVADKPPPFTPIRSILAHYSEPYNLGSAKVAYQSRIVEKGNWKLVWENNRECYHCDGNHPELIVSFPENWVQSEDGDCGGTAAATLKLPSQFIAAADKQYRIMRHSYAGDARSMTMSGQPIGEKRFGQLAKAKDDNIGNVPFYHYPSTWNHWQADYAVSFRVTPISPEETEVVTTYLVPGDATEGVDYDLKTLTEVWEATNRQDQELVARVAQGISSPAFVPGTYNEKHEAGVIEFVEWYAGLMKQRLSDASSKL